MTEGRRAWEIAQLRRPEPPRHAEPDEVPTRRRRSRSQWWTYADGVWWRLEFATEAELRKSRASIHGFAVHNNLRSETRSTVTDDEFILFVRFTPRSSPNGQEGRA